MARPIIVACVLMLAACRSKQPAPDATAAAPTAPPTAPEPKKPIVTPKTIEELGARVVEALVDKDVARLAAYVPSDGFLERHCPEMAPAMRTSYTDKIKARIAAAKNDSSKCHELDWKGATLVSVERKDGGGPDFYGCANVADDRVSFVIQVGDDKREVEMSSMLTAHDAFFVGAPLTCRVPTPCASIVEHLESLVKAASEAPEKGLDADSRGAAVAWCEGLWDFPDKREALACMRSATSYAGLARCRESIESLFTTWPRK